MSTRESWSELVLLFRHCVSPGEERQHIEKMIETAKKRYVGYHENMELVWKSHSCDFSYTILLSRIDTEPNRLAEKLYGIKLPRASWIGVPERLMVQGTFFLLPNKVKVEAKHTSLPTMVQLIAQPFIKAIAKTLIIEIAREHKLQLTAA